MNICVVSTFDGTTDDFMEIYNWAKDKASAFATDFEVGVIREGKVITMANVTDMEKFQEIYLGKAEKLLNKMKNQDLSYLK